MLPLYLEGLPFGEQSLLVSIETACLASLEDGIAPGGREDQTGEEFPELAQDKCAIDL
jgi:hypothetical protein